MSATISIPFSKSTVFMQNNSPLAEQLNPLKQVQTGIAPTKRQKMIANRRKNFKMKKKTELCKNYVLGEPCPLGENCSFAHGYEELKPRVNASTTFRTIKCRHYYDHMFCQYGPRCQFLHNDKRGEVKRIKLNYTQLLTMMEDSYTVKKAASSFESVEDFLRANLNLTANRIPRLSVFETFKSFE